MLWKPNSFTYQIKGKDTHTHVTPEMKQIFIMLLLRLLVNNNMRKCMWTPCERSTYVLTLVKRGMITCIALWSVFSLCIVYQFLHNVKDCTSQGGGLLQKFGISSIVKAEIAEALRDKSLQDEEHTTPNLQPEAG